MAQSTLLFIGLLFVTVSLAYPQGPPDGVISQGPPPGVVPTGSQYQGPPPGVVPGPPQAAECPNPSTIESFDKDKYVGDWYQSQGIPTFFQPSGTKCVRATYGNNGKTLFPQFVTN